MDRFIERTRPPPSISDSEAASHSGPAAMDQSSLEVRPHVNMSEGQEEVRPSTTQLPTSLPLSHAALTAHDPAYTKIAEAVAALLSPTITSAVETAISQGMAQIHKEIGIHRQRLAETDSA